MNPSEKSARHLLRLTVLLALAPLILMLAGAVGTKLGLWGWRFGFGQMTVRAGSGLAFVGVIAGLVSIYVARFAGFRRLWPLAAVSLLLPILVVVAFAGLRANAKRFPGHDIATTWTPPLMFSARTVAARGEGANPVNPDPRAVWGNEEVENWMDRRAETVNASICPSAQPARLTGDRQAVFARVKAALADQNLTIAAEDPATGRIEAVAESFWFGFKDDVAAQITPDGAGWRVDLRSVSRVGRSDLGANCARVTKLSEALSA